MGRYGPELRGQHGDPIEHVLLWTYPGISHTGNSYIFLQSFILLGLSTGFKFCKSFISLLFKIHSCQFLFHVHCIMEIFLSTFPTNYLLELSIRNAQKACKRFLHNRIGKRTVELNISPLISIGPENVLAKEPSGNRPEGFLLIGICRFQLS